MTEVVDIAHVGQLDASVDCLQIGTRNMANYELLKEVGKVTARSGKRALGILTVSDHILTGEATTSEQRKTTFTNMMEVALSLV